MKFKSTTNLGEIAPRLAFIDVTILFSALTRMFPKPTFAP